MIHFMALWGTSLLQSRVGLIGVTSWMRSLRHRVWPYTCRFRSMWSSRTVHCRRADRVGITKSIVQGLIEVCRWDVRNSWGIGVAEWIVGILIVMSLNCVGVNKVPSCRKQAVYTYH